MVNLGQVLLNRDFSKIFETLNCRPPPVEDHCYTTSSYDFMQIFVFINMAKIEGGGEKKVTIFNKRQLQSGLLKNLDVV